ncbi:MAG: hypothetical protein Q7T87_11580 [Polaromonas sp.]|nr:hypothetical protein [Polaromonas sp.]
MSGCKRWVLPAGALLLTAAAQAQGTPPRGVWEGTLGDRPIIACFNGEDFGGSYYYTKFLRPIQLAQNNNRGPWHEEGRSGSWQLNKPEGQRMTGTWLPPKKGSASLPLDLTLVAGGGENLACGSDAYNTRIEAPLEITPGKPQKLGEHRWRKLHFGEQETVEIMQAGQVEQKINQQLRRVIDTRQERVSAFYQTRRKFLSLSGVMGKNDLTAEPVYWSSQWISVRFHRWMAEGGEGAISTGISTWDLTTGAEVDLWTWFGGRSRSADVFSRGSEPLPPALRSFLFRQGGMAGKKPAAGCENNGSATAPYVITLKKTSMRFSQEMMGNGCDLSFDIPYAELTPVLTAAGKVAIQKTLQARP